jgi:AhpD family alkylhydroperoxidase
LPGGGGMTTWPLRASLAVAATPIAHSDDLYLDATQAKGARMSWAGPLIADDEASAEVRALYGDIRATRGVELISNFWRALANDPPTLRRMWKSFNSTMAPGALDLFTKELLFLAVSATNGCAYCTALHGTAAQTQGMSSEMLDELVAVVGLANEATRLAAVYRIPVDDRYEGLLDELTRLREIDRRRAAAERAQKNLSRYFAPKLAAMLAGRDEALGAVGRQTVAVLFVDIVGFTAMSETMRLESVVTMLRQYHDHMTAAIVACEGTVEKYIGDEIFAVFGLPTQGDRDAVNALRCAERMLQALDRWNEERRARNEFPLQIGIGLHYGPVVVGDIGSAHGMSFTLIGDTVNIASRLQGLTRDLATPLVVGDPLIRAVGAQSGGDAAGQIGHLEDRGEHALRGRNELVRIWTRARSDPTL